MVVEAAMGCYHVIDRLFSKKKWMEVAEQPAAQLRCATLDGLVLPRLGQNKYREGDNPASWACRSLSLRGPAHLRTR